MLRLENVSHQYNSSAKRVISDVCLTIEKGTCFGLLGPNGAGKTTLISLMSGLLPLQSGCIYFDNEKLHQLSNEQAQCISLIPQEYAFYPQLTVYENLQFFASLYKIKNKNFLLTLLEKVDLVQHRNVYAKNLSGGLKRRLNFAIGLVNSPKIIFMDEITVGIDPVSRQFILDSVKQLTQQGVTIIYTSHYLHEIEMLCQKIAIMESGKVRFCDDIHSILYQQAEQQCTITLAKKAPQSLLTEINALVIKQDPFQTLHINVNNAMLDKVFNQLQPYQIHSIQYGYGSLESFYLDFLTNIAHNQTGDH